MLPRVLAAPNGLRVRGARGVRRNPVPLIANLHRYFFYMAILIAILLTYDAAQAFRRPNQTRIGLDR